MDPVRIKNEITNYILREILWGAQSETISDDTALISDGLLDSLAVLRLVAYLEESYNISIKFEQMNLGGLDKLDSITQTVVNAQRR